MINAAQLAAWADTIEAQGELPRLVRRLTHAVARTTRVSIPAGDSVVLPGFDGEVYSEAGNAWVPAGHSCWEMSCRADVITKANEDFKKRIPDLPTGTNLDRTYIAVTARRWPSKERWRRDKSSLGLWKEVRAYDADDLEQWLEQAPAVALAFAEELGIAGPGVESPSRYIGRWGGQSAPAITPEALLTGREEQAGKFLDRVRHVLSEKAQGPLAVKADSVQEAVAFAVAAVLGDASLAASAIVVTSADGWRFVETNPDIHIAVAATPVIAEAPTSRSGLAIIVPYASGDMARQFKGAAGRPDDNELHLDRAMHSEFEKALQLIGLDENDTGRLSTLCGRSWSVFRRQHATNPAIRRPAWLDHPASSALAPICLVGAWSSQSEADREIVSRIAGKAHAELEADLLELERLDDSPLLHIGSVWKAKSALELLAIFGERITRDALDRYFQEVEAILAAPDPQLELPKEERYAASLYGKTRPISGLLLDALCDTLIKLSVRGVEFPSLALDSISLRVDRLVSRLLRRAGRVRWLSLSNQLPALAEASPHEFLLAVEDSIGDTNGGVQAIFLESRSGCCWHAGMLWALETLAWAPNRLKRVSLILAKLCDIRLEGNWGNTPKSSLLALYRSWFPQTGATIEQRIEALDFLIEKAPEPAYTLLDSLSNFGPAIAFHTARPKWRDEDAGAGYGASGREQYEMAVAAIDRQIDMSAANPGRAAKLIWKYTNLDEHRQKIIIKILGECQNIDDVRKDEIRKTLRQKIYWHINIDESRDEQAIDTLLDPLIAAYAALEPKDIVIRHAWLFRNEWVEPPFLVRDDDAQGHDGKVIAIARAALREIFDDRGWEGVITLATGYGDPWIVGSHLSRIGLPLEELGRWIAEDAGDLNSGEIATRLASAILCTLSPEDRSAALDAIFALAWDMGRNAEWMTRLIILCPHDRSIWQRAEAFGQSDFFWTNCSTNLWLDDPEDMAFALRSLLDRQRPVSALNACSMKISSHAPELICEMLEGIIKGYEVSENRWPRSYTIQRAIDYLEVSNSIEELRLAQIEYALIRVLGFDNEHHAKSLYHVLMSRPEVFVDLLCLTFKRSDGEARELDEAGKAAAEMAWHVLHACKRQPGTRKDGTVDFEMLVQYIAEARRLAEESGRLSVCDIYLGEIMAHAPEGADGIWPFEPVRDGLEQTGSDEMMEGFHTGCLNKRGVHVRGAYEGGDQERALAERYRTHSYALETTHPRLSAVLMELARYYDRDGIHADQSAKLRQEGH